ncbi:MAG: hypothetical protein J7604_22755 [Sporocytophaga sp.]|uniref:hypothetical protein n=1 Tax=Sporocytophaga sp. TaxID=2231183 RepID=UPI001B06CECD|nr:hypothetical protein [Sporocytophaga sp.]MBO9703053.1 hypothetical protein [Sporocytophaga sp.]
MKKAIVLLLVLSQMFSCTNEKIKVVDFGKYMVSLENYKRVDANQSKNLNSVAEDSIRFKYFFAPEPIDTVIDLQNGEYFHFKCTPDDLHYDYQLIKAEKYYYLIKSFFQSGGFEVTKFDKKMNKLYQKKYSTIIPNVNLWRNTFQIKVSSYDN